MTSAAANPVRLAMVGGGEGAFIGNVHRLAARLDGAYQLVAGAFSRDADNCKRTGASLNVAEDRCYASWEDMFKQEAALPEDQRIECVAIVTPNHLHVPISAAALNAGFHVMCDKPAGCNLAETEALEQIIADSGKLYGLTHTYLGYPMVAEARHLVAESRIGVVRKIYVEYPQGWLANAEAEADNKQAAWRLNPELSGFGGSIADIGTHAFTLAEWISGQMVTAICAELNAHVDGRLVDDDASALLKYSGGATGVLTCSQVCVGEENGLKIRLYGERGALEWHQMEPNSLIYRPDDGPMQILRAGVDKPLSQIALSRLRTPSGHPEGYLEAFANLYTDFAEAVRAGEAGTATNVPGIKYGIRGMKFIERMIESDRASWKWTDFDQGGQA